MRRIAFGFVAGFLATLIFHQIALTVLLALRDVPIRSWDLSPVWPFGVPRVISLSFWGGVWGILLAWLEPRLPRLAPAYWGLVILFGAVAPTAVSIAVVRPLRGQPVPLAQLPSLLPGGFFVNAAWGIGTVLFLLLAERIWAKEAKPT